MKYLFILIIAGCLSNAFGYEFSKSSYINISKSEKYAANIVRLSTQGGNVEEAVKSINTLDSSSFSYHLHYGLLNYQLYGKRFIDQYEDSLRLFGFKEQDLLFAKMWWADKSGNYQDFYKLNNEYEQLYGNGLYKLRYETLFFTEKGSFNIWERDIDSNLIDLKLRINLQLSSGKLSKQDSLLALLLLCDVIDKLESGADSDNYLKEIFNNLNLIWSRFPEAVDLEELADKLEDLEIKKAYDLALKVHSARIPQNGEEAVSLAFRFIGNILNRESYRTSDILNVEKLLTSLIERQSDEIIKVRIKALLLVVLEDDLLSDLPFGFQDVNANDFSDEFREFVSQGMNDEQFLAITIQIIAKGSSLLDEDFQHSVEELQALMKDNEWATLSSKEKALIVGAIDLMIQQSYQILNSSLFKDFNDKEMANKEYASLTALLKAISKNPLLLTSDNLEFKAPVSKNEYNSALELLDEISNQYPGSVSVLRNKLHLLFNIAEFIPPGNPDHALEMFRTVIRIFELSQLEGSELFKDSDVEDYFVGYSSGRSYYDIELVIEQMSENEIPIIEAELKLKQEAYPDRYNISHLYLVYLFYTDKLSTYLNHYVDMVLRDPNTRANLNTYIVRKLDNDTIQAALDRYKSLKKFEHDYLISKIEEPLLEILQER